jgi:hypothetical protein
MRRNRAALLTALLLMCAGLTRTHGAQLERFPDHSSHAPVTADERGLRVLLDRYGSGDVAGAIGGLLQQSVEWSDEALAACLRRIDEEITYHRRPANRLGDARDERLEQHLRGDRLRVLQLTAALQLDATAASDAVGAIGSRVLASERAVEKLYALRRDFDENGDVPWPPGADHSHASRKDWQAVRAFVERWYPAAVSRLQHLVELRLAPALIERGLARFPQGAELLLARGSLFETRLALARVDASNAPLLYPPDVRQRWRDDLSSAEADLQRAVEVMGPASEAAARLARLRLSRGEAAAGRELLDRALARQLPPEVRYLALLFRAAAAHAAGDAGAAVHDYEAAAAIMPAAQTPPLALARIADEEHRRADARTWIDRALAAGPSSVDPWRRYIQGQGWQLDTRLEALRRLATQ